MATCKDRWANHKNSRMTDLQKLWKAHCLGLDKVPDLGSIYDYGLSFEYRKPSPKRPGFWVYLLSTGGPQEELRYFADSPRSHPYQVEFAFLDWFDGYSRALRGKDLVLALELWDWFSETGVTSNTLTEWEQSEANHAGTF